MITIIIITLSFTIILHKLNNLFLQLINLIRFGMALV
jgi:hypothetical protein